MIFAPMVVNVLGIKLNSMDHMSTFSMGPTQQTDLYLANKRNQGFGEDNGDLNLINLPFNTTVDTDLIDSTSQKTSFV